MNKKKALLVIILFGLIITVLQANVNASYERVDLAEKFKNMSGRAYSIINNNVMLGENLEEQVKITVKDEVFYEQLVGSYGAKKTDNPLEVEMTRQQINDLKEFEYLGNNSKVITDITGIENFVQLETLKLNRNNIKDVTVISQLTKLKNIEIKANELKTLPDLSALTNLQTLDISDNSINSLEGIKNNYTLIELNASSNQIVNIIPVTENLRALQELNLSTNNISDISTIHNLNSLVMLDLSFNTSIREVKEITELQNLTKLSLANDNNIIDLVKLLNKKDDNKTPKLINLQELNLEHVNNSASKISVSNLTPLKNLKELNLNNNELANMTGVIEFDNLEKLYLSNNKIKDITPLVKFKSETINGETRKVVDKVSKVKDLRMGNNEIEDISVLSYLSNTITYLDLSENHIHHIYSIEVLKNLEPKNLYLQNQTANFNIKRKSNTSVKQKIILESIIQKCKDPNSKIYDSNASFNVTGDAVLNTDTYTVPGGKTGVYSEEPGNYNIVFAEDVKKGNVGTVTINGGRATGSVYTYTITDNTGSKVYDSICFEDYYLAERVYNDLSKQERNIVGIVPYIINIEYPEIAKVTELTLTGDEGRRVKNIKGLESFINLKILNLSTNDISSDNSISKINLLKDLPNIEQLNLSDNQLEMADVITNFKLIKRINLANNNISSLQPFEEWVQNLKDKKTASKLTEINVSGNNIEDLTPIKDITTLEYLNVSKNKIKDINAIENMAVLNALNISSNKIEDIEPVGKLTRLTTLYLATNKVKDISSLRNLNLSKLDISNNRIESLDDIKNMSSLTELKLNTNKISTIEPIKDLVIGDFEITYQKLCYALTQTGEEIVSIDLEKLFKEAKEGKSIVYAEKDFECTNCTLTEDGKIQINLKDFGDKIATVKIKDGNAKGSQMTIARPLKPIIKYNIESITNKDVIATIEFDGRQANIMNNDGKNSYTFTENGEFTFDYEDEYGFTGTITAKVHWIDKDAPVITGVQNEQTYNVAVTPVVSDENLETIELVKDGNKVEGYASEEITENGKYTLTAKDKAGNITVVTFTINLNSQVKSLTGIEIISQPSKNIYKEGEKFDRTGMKVQAIYSDGSKVEVTDYTVIGEEDSLQIGTTSVRITYTENGSEPQYAEQEITVIPQEVSQKELIKIEITNPPTKTSYVEGENFDKAGMIVTAIYNNGETKQVENYVVTNTGKLTIGTVSIEISYTEGKITQKAKQSITVKEKEPEKLTINIKGYEEKTGENVKYIKGISPQTTLEDFKNSIETNGKIRIKSKTTEIADKNAKIGTGMTLEIALNNEKEEYTLVVIGDCNGSGTTNVADLTKLMMSRAESLADNKDENKILKGAYAEAADLNNDGKISVADITKLCMFIAENK